MLLKSWRKDVKNDEKNLSTNKGSSIIIINDNNKFQFWSVLSRRPKTTDFRKEDNFKSESLYVAGSKYILCPSLR